MILIPGLVSLWTCISSYRVDIKICKTTSLYLAESGLHYAINRIEHGCWLDDIQHPSFVTPYTVSLLTGNVGIDSDVKRWGHYIHFKGQNPDEIADFKSHNANTQSKNNLYILPKGGSFKVWASPETFRHNGLPVWNGKWNLICEGSYKGYTCKRSFHINITRQSLQYSIFSNRSLTIHSDPSKETRINGSIRSNGNLFIGNGVYINAGQIPVIALGNTQLNGYIDGSLQTSSVIIGKPNISLNVPHSKLIDYITGAIELIPAYEQFHSNDSIGGYYPHQYRILKIWAGESKKDHRLLEYPQCLDCQGSFNYEFLDAFNRVDCIEGFKGIWIDTVTSYDYPALAASQVGIFSQEALNISNQMIAALEHKDFDSKYFSFEHGIPIVFLPSTSLPETKHLLKKSNPVLDWDCLYKMAVNSKTIFSGWDEFTNYINNSNNNLVHHKIDSNEVATIYLGHYNPKTFEPLKAVIFYIKKSAGDDAVPDRGCFGILQSKASIQINGSIICERSFDLRDSPESNDITGRWREFTTGKDGRVIPFCGGLPLIKADNPDDCRQFGIYKWCIDGAQGVTVHAFPGVPAIATMGDFWIVNRHYSTILNGSIYAPYGHIRIANPPSKTGNAAIQVKGFILGRDIEIIGPVSIQYEHINPISDYYKYPNSYRVSIVSQSTTFI